MVVAKTDAAHHNLARQIMGRSVKRVYLALATGEMKDNSATINVPIGRDERRRERMGINHKTGKTAITHYRVLKRAEGLTFLELTLETGRTHQIRVHLASIGHPVFGDAEYGGNLKEALSSIPASRLLLLGKLKKVKRQLLHAARLEFRHPVNGNDLRFEAALPCLFQEIIDLL